MNFFLIVLVCLLFVKNVFAQDRNANWELKTITHYSDGIVTNTPSAIFIYDGDTDSINEINLRIHKLKWEKFQDSLCIVRKGKFKNINVTEVEYWVKPLRKIVSKDSFVIEEMISKPEKMKTINDSIFWEIGENENINTVKQKHLKNFSLETIFKLPKVNGYYCLGKYPLVEKSSLRLDFRSTDTSLKSIISSFSNINNKFIVIPTLFGVYPISNNWFSATYQNMLNEEIEFNNKIKFPSFTWKNSEYKMNIDTTFLIRKLITDTINGKINYRICKFYLEKPKELIVDSKNNSFIFLMSRLQENNYYQYKLVPWLDYTGEKNSMD